MWFTIIGLALSAASLGLQASASSDLSGSTTYSANPVASPQSVFSENAANNAAFQSDANIANSLIGQENSSYHTQNTLLIVGIGLVMFGVLKMTKIIK